MVKAENLDDSQSVEHLIPNAILTKKRPKADGDFYACRRCNTRKSNIDYVLGVVAKTQSIDEEMAMAILLKATTDEPKRSYRFLEMIQNAKRASNVVMLPLPIKGAELIEYCTYLGKGQYFRKMGRPFNPASYVMEFDYFSKDVLRLLEVGYQSTNGKNAFSDLASNPYSEVIGDGECIIWSKNLSFMFVFHRYTGIAVRVLRRSRRNEEKTNQSHVKLLKACNS